ncbi:MAG: LysR substrate-binding domain-containing protein [Pseudomonadota bacterium]
MRQLNYALAVEKTLHFKKAAEACAISQSALSTALTEMEKQLGFQVFERDNKKVLITPLGKEVLAKAQAIKLQMDDLYKLADAQKSPLSYPMSIGIIPTIGPYLLPIILPALNKHYPGLQLNIVEEQSHVLLDKVRRGDIDTAILALPYDCEGLLSFSFWQEDFYWVAHQAHSDTQRQEITADELDYAELMLLEDGHCLKDHISAVCRLSEGGTHSLSATSLSTLVHLVAGKIGTTLVPEIALDQLVSHNALLSKVHLNEPGPHRELAFIVRPNYSALNNIEHLIKLFKNELNRYFSRK